MVSRFKRLFCLFGRHGRGDRTNWNGLHYESECRHCGVDIRRVKRGTWRRRTDKR